MILSTNSTRLIVVFLGALVLRLFTSWQLEDSPLIETAAGASMPYAQSLQRSTDEAPRVALSPLYSAILQALPERSTARVVQAILGAAACVLVAVLGGLVAGAAGGWMSGMAAAAYGPALLYGAEMVPATSSCLLAMAALCMLVVAVSRDSILWHAASGLAVGAAVLTEVRLVLLVPAAVLWMRALHKPEINNTHLAAFALPAVAVCGAGATWVWAGLDLPGPGQALERLVLAWHSAEVLPDLDPYGPGYGSWLTASLMWERGLAVPFGIIAPLGVVGVVMHSGSRGSTDSLLLWFVAAATVGALVTLPSARGRLPVAFALLPLAASGLLQAFRGLVPQSRRSAALLGTVTVALVLTLGAQKARAHAMVSHHHWLGVAYEQLDMQANAMAAYEMAVATGEAPTDAYHSLARLYAAAGAPERSAGVFGQLAQQRPQDTHAQVWQGRYLMAGGRAAEAEQCFRLALARGAERGEVLGQLGDALGAQGDLAGSIEVFSACLEARPDSHRVRFQLAVALGEDGHATSAEVHYRRLLQVTGWEVRAGWRLAELLATNETRRGEAEALLRQALSKSPNLRPALWRLARLLHEAGRHEEALVPLERLQALNPQDYRAYHLLASVYEHLGQSHLAADSYLTYERLQRQATIHRRVSDQALDQAQRLAKR